MSKVNGQERGSTLPAQNIYEISSTQKCRIGERLVLGDRVFRYCKNSSAGDLAPGYMTAGPAGVANHTEVVQTGYTNAIGAKVVNVLLTTTVPTAHQYDDGYLVVNKATGLAQSYKIKSHTLAVAPCVITLYDPLVIATDATSEVTLVPSKYRDVVVMPTTAAAPAVGVPLLAVTASYYFWAQTKGIAPAMVDTADGPAVDILTVGEPAGYPTSPVVPGAFGLPTVTDQIWGNCWYAATNDEVALVDLRLE